GVRVGLHLSDGLQGLQIENHGLPGVPVGDESTAEFRNQGDSVVPFQSSDLADYGPVIRIEHFDLGTVRQIDASRRSIESDVVKVFAAALGRPERNLL